MLVTFVQRGGGRVFESGDDDRHHPLRGPSPSHAHNVQGGSDRYHRLEENRKQSQSDRPYIPAGAAEHLDPGGRFVIEVGVPDLRRLPPGQTSIVFRSDDTGWNIDDYDVANQGLISHHLDLVDGDIRRFSVPFRLRVAGRAGPDG
ncbi:MAG TPA: hypothetical protein VLA91_10245 [Acidimicrobiia bacterium]|nr:hypothetical protein [Acidimicrobiia bacterium]